MTYTGINDFCTNVYYECLKMTSCSNMYDQSYVVGYYVRVLHYRWYCISPCGIIKSVLYNLCIVLHDYIITISTTYIVSQSFKQYSILILTLYYEETMICPNDCNVPSIITIITIIQINHQKTSLKINHYFSSNHNGSLYYITQYTALLLYILYSCDVTSVLLNQVFPPIDYFLVPTYSICSSNIEDSIPSFPILPNKNPISKIHISIF